MFRSSGALLTHKTLPSVAQIIPHAIVCRMSARHPAPARFKKGRITRMDLCFGSKHPPSCCYLAPPRRVTSADKSLLRLRYPCVGETGRANGSTDPCGCSGARRGWRRHDIESDVAQCRRVAGAGHPTRRSCQDTVCPFVLKQSEASCVILQVFLRFFHFSPGSDAIR